MLESTLAAIQTMDAAYQQLLQDKAPAVVRQIVLRAMGRLEREARRMLTGE